PLALEMRWVAEVRRVQCQLARDRRERLGAIPEQTDAERENYNPGANGLAVLESDGKAAAISGKALHTSGIERRGNLLLEPVAVCDEILNGKRLSDLSERLLICKHRQMLLRSVDTGCFDPRPQQHTGRHVFFPEGHRLSNDVWFDSRRTKMRSDAEAVGSRANDDHVGLLHQLLTDESGRQ